MALREVSILIQLTKMEHNKYTTKLVNARAYKRDQSVLDVFLVLEYLPTDLK